ncbi:MAG: DUF302 domain-containing protein [Leptonema sp. (in: Bacteria)]|nr:DUF302 domain-containing protein [Leptonema sp. (in: bacteria)]
MYALIVDLKVDVNQAIESLRQALQTEKMGIVSDVDFQANMKEKMNHEMAAYRILGICGPKYAKRIVEAEPTIGAMMPCSCAVYDTGSGVTRIAMQMPEVMASVTENTEVKSAMNEARQSLDRVMALLKK